MRTGVWRQCSSCCSGIIAPFSESQYTNTKSVYWILPDTDRLMPVHSPALCQYTLQRYASTLSSVMPVHSPAFELQLNVRFTEMTLNNKILFRWYNVVHVLVREELRDTLVFPTRENVEHRTQRACSFTTWSECNISGLSILLGGRNTAAGSLAISGRTVSTCLLTARWKSVLHSGQ